MNTILLVDDEPMIKVGFPVDDFLQTVWGVGYKWARKDSK